MLVHLFVRQHEDLVQVIFYASVITMFWMLERFICLHSPAEKRQHIFLNAKFILTALPIQLGLTTFVILIINWTNRNHWGLIYYVPWRHNVWLYYISLFLLLDLGEYTYHRVMHKIDMLWKFHLVHHSDMKVDISTTVREHPGETVVRVSFLMLWVFLLGPVVSVLMLRQVFQTFFNIMAHTEFRLPRRLNTVVGAIFITPNLHHVHHHYELPYTDCNYGDVLSIWDRLFGTYQELSKNQVNFGIDTHMDVVPDSGFLAILKIPFKKLERNKRSINHETDDKQESILRS